MNIPQQRQASLNFTPILAGAALVLAGYLVLDKFGWFTPAPKGEPRLVQARGDLAEFEKTTIQIFEANSPSVVHITTSAMTYGSQGYQEIPKGTGTGFIWDNLVV